MNEPRSSLDWISRAGANTDLRDELRARAAGRRRRQRRIACLAAVALVVLGVGWVSFSERALPGAGYSGAQPGIVVTIPERRTLPDGTVAELRAGAGVEVDFSKTVRRVRLLRGEAHFAVTSDPARPFVVGAGRVEVRAVGTAFSVELSNADVEVVVTEGRIAVEHAAQPLATAGAGDRVVVSAGTSATPATAVVSLDAAQLADKLAWRVPRLEFSATPLREALPLFNRHSAVKLVLAERALQDLQISGVVRADQPDVLIALLAANYGVAVETRPDGSRVLRAR